ncbi:MAG: hypothetical protein AABZ60_20105 [Planctomycetota bacterium]
MKSAYDKVEVVVGILGLLSVPFLFWKTPETLELNIEDIFKWSGILLLGQGFIRDIILLTFYRERLKQKSGESKNPLQVGLAHENNAEMLKQKNGESKKGLWICVESTLGVLLVLLYFLLLGAEAELKVKFPLGVWALGISCFWIFGYVTREFILELKRDPNHLNLIVGF